ncbi:uimc1 [Pungitius sinensis]
MRGHSSSSASQERTGMAPRKQLLKDAGDVPPGSQQDDENTPEDEALDDQDDNDELSSSPVSSALRDKRISKSKDMTEEEMMDLALRLSEQEAGVAALRLQQEEEAMRKAIQESMDNQTQSLLTDAEGSLRTFSRRKLLYANGRMAPAINQRAAEDVRTPETGRGGNDAEDAFINRLKKRKRKAGSPLLEMPDLSQAHKVFSQASPCSSDCLSASLDSPQSSDSTQIDACQPPKSPVFPSTECRAKVQVARLSKEVLDTWRTLGFVSCSQDSRISTQKSQTARAKSPTFPESPKRSNNLAFSESSVFSVADQGDDGEIDLTPEYVKSPVFGRNKLKTSQSACEPRDWVCTSLTSSVKSTSCCPKSQAFPKSPGLRGDLPATDQSATRTESAVGQAEQSRGRCRSPVFGAAAGRQEIRPGEQERSSGPPAAERPRNAARAPPRRHRQDSETDHKEDPTFKSSISDCSSERMLSGEVTLLWSEDDDDDDEVTPEGSPSPVFPEERPAHQAHREDASQDHVTAAPGKNCSSSSSTSRQQPSTEPRPQPISSQGAVSRPSTSSGELAGGATVCYYWGVPFCPKGVDPDEYTQVILSHMEAYEKSLKQAQRCLLRKAEWGEAVLPQPEKSPSSESPAESPQKLVPRRRGLKLRSRTACESANALPDDAEEDEEDEKDEEGERERKEEEEEEAADEGEEGPVDADDCEVCPETQLSDNDDDRTQDLMIPADPRAKLGLQFDSKKSPEPPEVEMILQVDSPAEDGLQVEQDEMEVDPASDRKTEANTSGAAGNEGTEEALRDPDVEETKGRRLQRSASPELEAAAGLPPSPESKVDCPICQGSFPLTEIERHAAYCDGEVTVVEDRRPEKVGLQVSLKPRRKRARRAEPTEEDAYALSNPGRNQEKCYICQKAVPLKDYGRHTELCLQRQAPKTAPKGNLLLALQQTESSDSGAGPSGSRLQPGEVIDLRYDDDDDDEEEQGSVSGLRISNSPIRSFTPISEATDCLIDFKKKPRPKTLRQRRR